MNATLLRAAAITARVLPPSLRRALYRLGPISGALRWLLNRAAPTGRIQVTVAAGSLEGKRLQLDLHLEKDYWLGTYESQLQEALTALVSKGMTVFDVGAHIGYLTLLFADLVGPEGKVCAFEPHPDNLDRLKTHLALNPMDCEVQVVPAAVGQAAGRADFELSHSTSMGRLGESVGGEGPPARRISVEVLDLDRFAFAGGGGIPDLIKIDVEGGETAVLDGMARLISRHGPYLALELHSAEAARGVWERLERAGYRLHQVGRGYPEVEAVESLGRKAYVLAFPGGEGAEALR